MESWKAYRLQLCDLVDKENPTDRFYLKVRSKISSWQTKPMAAMEAAWDILTKEDAPFNILATYVTRPFLNKAFGLVLMHDRGSRLRDVTLPFDKKTVSEFSNICKTALFLSQHLPHGDVLPHNLVVDQTSGKMTLIDLDEGVAKDEGDDHIVQRENSYVDDDQNWFIALSYPNPLRCDAPLYTKSQLLATFLILTTRMPTFPTQLAAKLDTLVAKAKHLGEELCRLDRRDHLVIDDSPLNLKIKHLVEEVEEDMQEVCGEVVRD